jgi:hypothetical protein
MSENFLAKNNSPTGLALVGLFYVQKNMMRKG